MAQERTDRTEQRAPAGRRVRAAKVVCAVVAGAGMLAGAVAGLTVADALYPDRGTHPVARAGASPPVRSAPAAASTRTRPARSRPAVRTHVTATPRHHKRPRPRAAPVRRRARPVAITATPAPVIASAPARAAPSHPRTILRPVRTARPIRPAQTFDDSG